MDILTHDETIRAPRWLRGVLLLALAFIGLSAGIALVSGGRSGGETLAFWATLPLSAAAVAFIYANFLALRIQVTPTELRFAYGLFRKRIPLGDVCSVEHRTYRWTRYGGWGLRYGMGGRRAWNMPGVPAGAVVQVRQGGRQREYFLSSRAPERLAGAIARAPDHAPAASE